MGTPAEENLAHSLNLLGQENDRLRKGIYDDVVAPLKAQIAHMQQCFDREHREHERTRLRLTKKLARRKVRICELELDNLNLRHDRDLYYHRLERLEKKP